MRRLLVVGIIAAAMLVLAPGAGATWWTWRSGALGANAKDAGSTVSQLRASAATPSSGYSIDVAAHLPGSWTLYGNWVEGNSYTCHSYAGTYDLGGIVWNPWNATQDSVPATVHYPSWESPC